MLVYYLICEGSLPIHYFLQPMDVINLDEDRQRDETEIKRMAVIFGRKEISRPLTKYEQKMNSAAIEMCLKNPGFLRKSKQERMDAARQKIMDDGFEFVKGRSRSKKDSDLSLSTPRRKQNKDFREERLKEVSEEISDLNERIGYKERRIEGALNNKNYKKADDIKEEIIALKQKRKESEAERKRLLTSDRRSKVYHRRKLISSGSSESSSRDVTPCRTSQSDSRSVTPVSSGGLETSRCSSSDDYPQFQFSPITSQSEGEPAVAGTSLTCSPVLSPDALCSPSYISPPDKNIGVSDPFDSCSPELFPPTQREDISNTDPSSQQSF